MTSRSEMTTEDEVLRQIARYTASPLAPSEEALANARLCLMDSLGCALLALDFPQCTKLLGPVVEGAVCSPGARVPGTSYELDPVQAAFNFGAMIRWLDYNDTWLAAEWGHPSDNLGGILMAADWRTNADSSKPVLMSEVLDAMIRAYEIQGVLALTNAFNRVGLDHVLLVRVASAAVVTRLLGGTEHQVYAALSHAFLDGGALRTYRHWPNTGSRKSWAAGDATSRGVRLALMAIAGEMGYDTALTAPKWGFQNVLFQGQPITLSQSLGHYVMENILFKVSFPAEFHAQTAVEAAFQLRDEVRNRWKNIQTIHIETQEPAIRIIDKRGPLSNPAARDHCLQYMVAVAMLFGELRAEHYEDDVAADQRIDILREKMEITEHSRYSADYLDPTKRSIANAIQIQFDDGTTSERVEREYPLGHRRRRKEAIPALFEKFRVNSASLSDHHVDQLCELFSDPETLDALKVGDFIALTRK